MFNQHKNFQNGKDFYDRKYMAMFSLIQQVGKFWKELLPIKEGLSTLRLKPLSIVEVEVMPIPMSRVNLSHTNNKKQD